MSNTDIIRLLNISNATIIGSASDKAFKYINDIDIEEYDQFEDKPHIYDILLNKFRDKFHKASKNPNIFITDFKCGFHNKKPVRWTKGQIKNGYQTIDGTEIQFVDCLKQKSTIKMDIVALINNIYTEFSDNYYFKIGNKEPNSNIVLESDVKESLLEDVKDYIDENNHFKALKRFYSYNKITKNEKKLKLLTEFFNSTIAHEYYLYNLLTNIIPLVISNKFRKPKWSDLQYNVEYVKKELAEIEPKFDNDLNYILSSKTQNVMKDRINKVAPKMLADIDDKTIFFIEKHNIQL